MDLEVENVHRFYMEKRPRIEEDSEEETDYKYTQARPLKMPKRSNPTETVETNKRFFRVIENRPMLTLTFEDIIGLNIQLPASWNLPQEFSTDYILAIPANLLQDAKDFAGAFLRTGLQTDENGKSISAEQFVQAAGGLPMNIGDPISRAAQDLIDITVSRIQKPLEDTLTQKFGNVLMHVEGNIRPGEIKQVYDTSRFILNKTYCLQRLTMNGEDILNNELVGQRAFEAVERMLRYKESDENWHPIMAYFRACAALFQMMVLVFPGDASALFWEKTAKKVKTEEEYTEKLLANYKKVKLVLSGWKNSPMMSWKR
jgi:hypothetical protein